MYIGLSFLFKVLFIFLNSIPNFENAFLSTEDSIILAIELIFLFAIFFSFAGISPMCLSEIIKSSFFLIEPNIFKSV